MAYDFTQPHPFRILDVDDKRFEYREDKAEEPILFIERFFRHSKGPMAGKLLQLEHWQKELIRELFGWYYKDSNKLQYREAYIQLPRKAGKMLDLNTPIPTVDGMKTMGTLEIGDKVLGSDGNPCNVVFLSEIHNNPESYEVEFSNGEIIKACADHQWQVQSRDDRKYGRGWQIKTTNQLLSNFRQGNEPNYSIQRPSHVTHTRKEQLIDPYLLGFWLGDGTSASGQFTIGYQDVESLERIKAYGEHSVREDKSAYNICLYGLQTKLRSLNLLNNKHVPDNYLFGDNEQRLSLLQGLLDTDGCITGKYGQVEFTNKHKNLCESVRTLASSFGWKAVMKSRVIKGTTYYRTYFYPTKDLNPFRLSRKADKVTKVRGPRERFHKIVDIRPCTPVPMRCIQVDSQDNTYLCGNSYITTHNTTLIAALGLYKLIKDMKEGCEIVIVATAEKQAGICFDIAKSAVLQDEYLSKRVKTARKWIEADYNGIPSVFKMTASDPGALHGMNISFAIIDELHAHSDREVYDVIKTSQGARENPLLVSITTPGNDKTSFCYQQYEYCKKLMTRELDNERLLPVIFELDKDDDWKDDSVWWKASPNLGVTVKLEDLKDALISAKAIPSEENSFKQLLLGMWVDQVSAWLPIEKWDACADEEFDEDQLKGIPCYMGLDLASTEDLTAVAIAWPIPGDKNYIKTWSFSPEATIRAKEKSSKFPYTTWLKQGHLESTPGSVIDYQYIRNFIGGLYKKYNVKEIAADPFNATQLLNELQDNDGLCVIETRSGTHVQNPAIKHMERLILNNELAYKPNPVLRWQFGNISVHEDGMGKVRFEKDQSKRKIDAFAALVNAFTRVVVNVKEEPKDKYVEWGFITS